MRALQFLLRLALALVLGLGPLGASVLAASLHAPFCGCTGCGPEAEAGGCCEAARPASDEPALVASGSGCDCSLAAPNREADPATAPRVGASHGSARVELERGQRAVELAWSPAPPLVRDEARAGPPDDREPGPAGSRRDRGAVRAAALGALRL